MISFAATFVLFPHNNLLAQHLTSPISINLDMDFLLRRITRSISFSFLPYKDGFRTTTVPHRLIQFIRWVMHLCGKVAHATMLQKGSRSLKFNNVSVLHAL